jgi:hypothetical protein
MQGILKSNHQKLCECLQDTKDMEPAGGRLDELEEEIKSLFLDYQEKMKELKRLVFVYEEKQKAIKNEIKRVRKLSNNLTDSKKVSSFALGKAMVLTLLTIQSGFFTLASDTDLSSFFAAEFPVSYPEAIDTYPKCPLT